MRLFLAIELPVALRDALESTQQHLRTDLPGWRWIDPDAVHLTVRFLGDVADGGEAATAAAWRTAVPEGPGIDLRVEGAGAFPPRGPARVLWAGVHDLSSGALHRLGEGLERRARELGFDPQTREFRPHLTIARAASASPTRPDPRSIPDLGQFRAAGITLFRSILSGRGVRYERIGAVPFDPAGNRP